MIQYMFKKQKVLFSHANVFLFFFFLNVNRQRNLKNMWHWNRLFTDRMFFRISPRGISGWSIWVSANLFHQMPMTFFSPFGSFKWQRVSNNGHYLGKACQFVLCSADTFYFLWGRKCWEVCMYRRKEVVKYKNGAEVKCIHI